MDDMDFLSPFERLLEDQCTPDVVRAIESGESVQALWAAMHESGFLDALLPERAGGADLSLAEVGPLLQALGRFAVPLPIAETMAARAIVARSGIEAPAGPIVLATQAHTGPVPFAKVAQHALIDTGSELRLVDLSGASDAGFHHGLAAYIPAGLPGVAIARPERGILPLLAVVRACMIAGASDKLLAMTVAYANDRVQFGKPIGRQQAVQQQLAVMAEKVIACRIAAQIGCASGLDPSVFAAATAKQVTSAAAAVIANIAHAVHGAIAISAEYDVQLYSRRLHEWRLADGSEVYWARILGSGRLARAAVPSAAFIAQR
jgi:alkylation response protein AidB-like acyl-CoA dehydrogenase